MKRTPINKVNRKRLAKLRVKQFAPIVPWSKAMPCCVPRCHNTGIHLYDLCSVHYQLFIDLGVNTFDFRYDVAVRICGGTL